MNPCLHCEEMVSSREISKKEYSSTLGRAFFEKAQEFM
jgi:hypothetical protein